MPDETGSLQYTNASTREKKNIIYNVKIQYRIIIYYNMKLILDVQCKLTSYKLNGYKILYGIW